ncbi:MAG: exosortase E/protease, VPEID-CTERM system [Vicinamibacteria bacterium]
MRLEPQLGVLVVTFLAVGEWESRLQWRSLSVREERRWLGHSVLYLAGLGLSWGLLRVSGVAMASLVWESPFGLLNSRALPAPLAWVLAIVLLDLARYCIHFAHHHVSALWRLHTVHHSDPELDLSTGLRTHPLDSVIVQAAYLGVVAVLAPPLGAVVLAECLSCFQVFFTHANARLPESLETPLRRFFVTPDMHRIHHSELEAEQQGNFGDLFSWWDRLFGTYIAASEGGPSGLVPGLRGLQSGRSLDLKFMLSLPFVPTSDRPQSGPSPILRAVLLSALAALELIGLQLTLDQRVILDSTRWWARVLWYYPDLFNIALLCAGSMAVLTRRPLAEAVRASRRDLTPSGAGRFLGAHILLSLLFYGLSLVGFQEGAAGGAWADLWFLSWAACGLLVVAAWGCALARPGLWASFLKAGSRGILWGLALGGSVWLGAQYLTEGFFEFGRVPTLMAVAAILRATGHSAFFTEEPARIGIDGFSVRMSAGCFGYEGVALVIAFTLAYSLAVRKELLFPRSLLLIPLAVGASLTMNVFRVTSLILIGAYRGKYAIEGFHSVAGWLYFAAIAAGIVMLSQTRWFAKDPQMTVSTQSSSNPAAPYLMPLLVLLATAMVTRIFTGGFDLLYPLRAVFVGAVLVFYRKRIAELGWRGSAWAALPGALIFLGWMALEPAPTPSAIVTGLAQLPGWAAVGWLAFRVIGSSLTVPFAEELAFRGYLMRKLTSADFESVPEGRASLVALVVSSLMFGMMHGRVLAGTLSGVALALTFSKRGRLADAVVAHGVANALIAVYALTTQQWSVWD